MKAANVPLVPNVPLPHELVEVHRPVIGLTIDPRTLIEIRRNRLKLIAPNTGLREMDERENTYVDPDMVRNEVLWARRICLSHGWPVVDVSHRSIEETAAAVIELAAHWTARHPDAAAG